MSSKTVLIDLEDYQDEEKNVLSDEEHSVTVIKLGHENDSDSKSERQRQREKEGGREIAKYNKGRKNTVGILGNSQRGGDKSYKSRNEDNENAKVEYEDRNSENNYEKEVTGESFQISDFVNQHGDIENVDLLLEKSTSERYLLDNSLLFNELLMQFRRHPGLVSKKVKLQLGQELVVAPDDVRRLIKEVQMILSAKDEFSHDDFALTQNPIAKSMTNSVHREFPVEWIKPILFDRRSIYISSPSLEELKNQNTIRFASHSANVTLQWDNFGFKGSAKSRRQSYQTAQLHNIARSAYVVPGKLLTPNNKIILQTPIRHFKFSKNGQLIPGSFHGIPNQYDLRCANAVSPAWEYGLTSHLEVYRIEDNISFEDLLDSLREKSNVKINVDKRVVSLPVIEMNLDIQSESQKEIGIRQIYPGEECLVVGLAIYDPHVHPHVHICDGKIDDIKYIEKLPASLELWEKIDKKNKKRTALIFPPDLFDSVIDNICPSQDKILDRLETPLRSCFNLNDVNKVLSAYGLTMDNMSSKSVTRIRTKLTQNIINWIDSHREKLDIIRQSMRSKNIQSIENDTFKFNPDVNLFDLSSELSDLSIYDFTEIKLDSNRNDLNCRKLLNSADNGDLVFLVKGINWLDGQTIESLMEWINFIKSSIAALQKENERRPSDLKTNCFAKVYEYFLTESKTLDLPRFEFQHISIKIEKFKHSLDFSELCLQIWRDIFETDILEGYIEVYEYRKRLNDYKLKYDITGPDIYRRFDVQEIKAESFDGHTPVGIIPTDGQVFDIKEWRPTDSDFSDSTNESEAASIIDSLDSQMTQVRFTNITTGRIPKSDELFESIPLILISNQFVVMMNPEKLNFTFSAETLKTCVLDVSQMFDELDDNRLYRSKYLRNRYIKGISQEDLLKLRKEAVERFHQEIGNEMNVKSIRKVGIIIARLLIELETHRPKLSFRRLFPLTGKKTIGSDEDTKYESFTEENKFVYLVTVASRRANLGAAGVLMENAQADNLKTIVSFALQAYDRFRSMPHIKRAYDIAAIADEKQKIVQVEKKKQESKSGFLLILGDSESVQNKQTEKLMMRMHDYNINDSVLMMKLKSVAGKLNNLLSLRENILRKLKFSSFRILEIIQQGVESKVPHEQIDDMSSNYNPDQYGKTLGTAACRPDSVCILNTFYSYESNSSIQSLQESAEKCMKLMKTTRIPRSIVCLLRSIKFETYKPQVTDVLKVSVTDITNYISTRLIRNIGRSDWAKQRSSRDQYISFQLENRVSKFPTDLIAFQKLVTPVESSEVLIRLDKISSEISKLNLKSIFDTISTKIGNLHRSYEKVTKEINAYPRFSRLYQWKWVQPILLHNVCLFKNINLYLRKHISLISHGLMVRMNAYQAQESKQNFRLIDEAKYAVTITKRLVVGDRVTGKDLTRFNQFQENYLEKYTSLSHCFKKYSFKFSAFDIEKVAVKHNPDNEQAYTNAVETLMYYLTEEMNNLIYFAKSEDTASRMTDSYVRCCNFLSEFIEWAYEKQQLNDFTEDQVKLNDARLLEEEVKRQNSLTKTQKHEAYLFHSYGLVRTLEDELFQNYDEMVENELVYQIEVNKADDDLYDEESAPNLFEGEIDDDI